MTTHLRIATGQCSDKGQKPINQDFHGAMMPKEPLLSSKGIAIALADGISSSDVSQIASEYQVNPGQVSKWKQQLQSQGARTVRLQQENGQLRQGSPARRVK